jgi:phosphoribosylamine--glycine ligase
MSVASEARHILVIGKDARTDAIASACLRSEQPIRLFGFAEMDLPGLKKKCERLLLGSLTDQHRLVEVVKDVDPDLVIIGPEEPLAAGFADELETRGIAVFGPTEDLARIESSKSWTRELVAKHDIPGNPEFKIFTSRDGLERYMEELEDFVIKPDGLTGGKGVRVFGEHLFSIDEAIKYAESLLTEGKPVDVEERLEGEEFSLQTITDGNEVIHLPLVQDHKRAYPEDEGPNTGGMGSYSSADHSLPFLDSSDVTLAKEINEKTIEALQRECARPYRGVLYGGFMAVADGVRLIEYNARFGDPEAMNVLPLLREDFVEICSAVSHGELGKLSDPFEHRATVCKYIVPENYPEGSSEGGEIVVPEDQQDRDNLKWFWAACEQKGDRVELSKSRAGAFVGIADSIDEAQEIAEGAASEVRGPVRHREDIGRPEVLERRISHIKAVRSGRAAAKQPA